MAYDDTLIDRLRNARHIMVFTGAGASAESGIRTFRDEMDGLWKDYSVDDVVSIDGFFRNPDVVWRWHEWFRKTSLEALPNEGHYAVSALETQVARLDVITQNIDELHQRAGSHDVIELHGSIHRVCCFDHRHFTNSWPESETAPLCGQCASLLRHDIVWFGESLPDRAITSAMQAAHDADVLLAIGTSSVVYPAAQIPLIAKEAGTYVVVINPDETPLSSISHAFIQETAGVALPRLFAAVWPDTFDQRMNDIKQKIQAGD